MGKTREITVEPCALGWAVVCDSLCQPLLFLSGGRAESQAKALAMAVARAGYDVCLSVLDRRRTLVGKGLYFAAQSGTERASPAAALHWAPLNAEAA